MNNLSYENGIPNGKGKALILELDFLDKNDKLAKQQSVLLDEMIRQENNVIENISILQKEGIETIYINNKGPVFIEGKIHSGIEISANIEQLTKLIVKDHTSGRIGLLIISEKVNFQGGNLEMDLNELPKLLNSNIFFAYKECDKICLQEINCKASIQLCESSDSEEGLIISDISSSELSKLMTALGEVREELLVALLNNSNNLGEFARELESLKLVEPHIAEIIGKLKIKNK